MTTPAVNVNVSQRGTGFVQTFPYDYPPNRPLYVPDQVWKTLQESRPKSISRKKNLAGWRDPTSWYHSGSFVTPCPTVQVLRDVPAHRYKELTGDGYPWSHVGEEGLPAFSFWLKNSAVSRALTKLKDKKFDVGVALAEMRDTAKLCESGANFLAEGIRGLKYLSPGGWKRFKDSSPYDLLRERRLKHNVRRYGRAFFDQFLEVQYGVRPFVQDCSSAAEALKSRGSNNVDTRSSSWVTVVGKASNRTSFQRTYPMGGVVGNGFGFVMNFGRREGCVVRLDYDVENAFLASLGALGVTNPAQWLWERTHFSFVVDWFAQVGDWINTWDATIGLAFKAGTISQIVKQDAISPAPVVFGSVPAGQTFTVVGGTGAVHHSYNFVRTVLRESPVQWVPRIKNPVSGVHVANAIALMMARFSK